MKTKLQFVKDKINSSDLVEKLIMVSDLKLTVMYLKNMTDREMVDNYIVRPLMENTGDISDFKQKINKNKENSLVEDNTGGLSHKVQKKVKENFPLGSFSEYLCTKVITFSECEYVSEQGAIIDNILRGNVILFIEEGVECISFSATKYQERGVTEPPTSVVINGPRAGFVEGINVNISLIRRRVCSSDLRFDELSIGRYTKTRVVIGYINSIVDDDVVKSITKKLSNIDIDGIIDSDYLVDYLSKSKYSFLKLVGKTEKPDVAVAKMLEGRVLILVDGSPICLTLPFLFIEDLQASDDYYQKNYRVTLLRYLRLFGIVLAILLPSIYVATESFHYKLLPTKFLVTIINSSQGLPLTPFLEVIFVIALFEILYESSIRMPKYMGMALSIVGALILGDTAVKAGLVSSPSVMIIALSGITIYTVPDQAGQLSLLRLFFVFLAGTLGIFGITIGILILIIYSCGIDSFGSPYFAPVAPEVKNDLKDGFVKVVTSDMDTRPESLNVKNKVKKNSKNK